PRYGFKARRGAKHAGFHKRRTQAFCQSIRLFQGAVDQDEALTILKRALPGNSASRSATRADYEHSKIAEVDRELAADGAHESFTISIRSDQFLIANTKCVYGSYATCRFIRFIDLPEARNFVRHRQIHSCEVQISKKTQSRSQFTRPDMKTRVLSSDLAGAQGGILHFGRKRMRNWITKDAQANRWINVARYLRPLLQIAERITLGGLRFHEPLSLPSFRAKSRNPV